MASTTLQLGSGWGPSVAVLALLAVGLRLWRGSIPRFLWATLALLGTLWLIGAAAAHPPARVPDSARYIYPGAIAVLLVAVEAARGVRIQRRGMTILYIVAAISLATNIALLRDGSRDRAEGRPSGSGGAHRRRAGPGTVWRDTSPPPSGCVRSSGRPGTENTATGYLAAVREFGSPAFSLPELREQGELTRDDVDAALADANGILLRPTSPPTGHCRATGGRPDGG